MIRRSSSIYKAWDSISKYGIRAGLQNVASRYVRSRLAAPCGVLTDYGWVLTDDAPERLLAPRTGPLRINWILSSIGQNGGGELNIFRAIHHLEQWGHQNRVYVLDKGAPVGKSAKTHLAAAYFSVEAPVEAFTGEVADSDALIATNWKTAYSVRTLSNTARKFYFVQDLENHFYADGSSAAFAQETYRWGFHGITLGEWIAQVLRSDFSMQCSSWGFSYDREIYSAEGPQHFTDGKKRVIFYVRPSTERRGFELGMLALALVAKRRPDVEFVLIGSRLSGQIPFPAVLPGILQPLELAKYYRSCTAALVLSHTNLSMLPLELMACGCPVVSNSGSSVEWLLNRNVAQIAHPTPDCLAQAILELIENDLLRRDKARQALAFAQRTDWIQEIRRIEQGLFEGLNLTHSTRQTHPSSSSHRLVASRS